MGWSQGAGRGRGERSRGPTSVRAAGHGGLCGDFQLARVGTAMSTVIDMTAAASILATRLDVVQLHRYEKRSVQETSRASCAAQHTRGRHWTTHHRSVTAAACAAMAGARMCCSARSRHLPRLGSERYAMPALNPQHWPLLLAPDESDERPSSVVRQLFDRWLPVRLHWTVRVAS